MTPINTTYSFDIVDTGLGFSGRDVEGEKLLLLIILIIILLSVLQSFVKMYSQ